MSDDDYSEFRIDGWVRAIAYGFIGMAIAIFVIIVASAVAALSEAFTR